MYKNWFIEFSENKQERHGILTATAKCQDERAVRKFYKIHHPVAQIKRVVEFGQLPAVQKAQAQIDRRAQVKTLCPRCRKSVSVEKGRFVRHTNKQRVTCVNSGSWAESRQQLSRRKA
ncbi:hypothetical protein HY772_06230 [Candidatus Woesearchaeota archaeon]|nr:hypothetical protein [Candidatus Woesearchaeota archaeon]